MKSDGLALPIDYAARYGAGHHRALVLGGGGIFFVAWQIAYLRELSRRGVDLDRASAVVGTSAGSLVAALATGRKLERAAKQLEFLSKVPSVVSAMAPSDDLNGSQNRALNLFRQASDAEPATIRAIGYAALAADAAPAGKIRRSVSALLAMRKWPSKALRITAVDTYTGERLVIGPTSGVPVSQASAASSSVPGLFTPQPVLDRKCMDGGVSGSGTHCDVVAGAQRIVILSLGAKVPRTETLMTIPADTLVRERAGLEAAGGEVFAQGPTETDIDTLMSPESIPDAIAMGEEQAAGDAATLMDFWR